MTREQMQKEIYEIICKEKYLGQCTTDLMEEINSETVQKILTLFAETAKELIRNNLGIYSCTCQESILTAFSDWEKK